MVKTESPIINTNTNGNEETMDICPAIIIIHQMTNDRKMFPRIDNIRAQANRRESTIKIIENTNKDLEENIIQELPFIDGMDLKRVMSPYQRLVYNMGFFD